MSGARWPRYVDRDRDAAGNNQECVSYFFLQKVVFGHFEIPKHAKVTTLDLSLLPFLL